VSGSFLYVVGTLLTWFGWGAGLWAGWLLVNLLTRPPGFDTRRGQQGLLFTAAPAGVALLAGHYLYGMAGTGYRFPLVWVVMPFVAWAAVVCALIVVLRVGQAWLALTHEERDGRLKAAGLWALAAVGFVLLYRRDEAARVEVLRGGVDLQLATVVAIALLALAAMAAMAVVARFARSRNFAKGVAIHTALIVGSIVFGIPFAWLFVTSFKEDRDMVAENGRPVWIPRVQQTVPYLDPRDPLFEGRFEGRTVQASLIERLPDGSLKLDILKPGALRGYTFEARPEELREVPKQIPLVSADFEGRPIVGKVVEEMEDGHRRVEVTEPRELAGTVAVYAPAEVEPVRKVGARVQNYRDALEYLPPETAMGTVYLKNTLFLVLMTVVGTILSSAVVAYAFSRLRFPGRNLLFTILLSTMMLPAAVTLLPQFLIFRSLGWIDTLMPLWVPAFFASAFNVFLLRQFFMQVPSELEDAAKIDGCSYPRTFWSVMLPQVKPALAVIAIWSFMGAWNNFMGPLIYINSPEKMPISYALQLFQGDRLGEPGLLMAFATLSVIPVLLLFFFAQRYFIEGVQLSGLGGR
jgi:multiple sugar transport system permease protein